jgi:hypothetical protein
MEFFQYEAARSLDFARDERECRGTRSKVSLDATLREEGSFSDSGDRKSGLVRR